MTSVGAAMPLLIARVAARRERCRMLSWCLPVSADIKAAIEGYTAAIDAGCEAIASGDVIDVLRAHHLLVAADGGRPG